MTGTAKMVASAPFTYGRRALKAGDEFDAESKDAAILERVGKASRPKAIDTAAPEAKKGVYRTRMLTAEKSVA